MKKTKTKLLLETTSLSLCLALTLGCQSSADDAAAAPTDPAASSTAAPPPETLGTTVSGAGLDFDLPAGWLSEPPSSSMRLAQASISGSGGPGQLSVFHFGVGGGGGVGANIQRWVGQVQTDQEASRSEVENALYKVSKVEVSGTLKASSIGSFPTTDQPGYTLLGAVVEGDGGPWFFRAVGPEATMAEQGAAFDSLLKSARPSAR